MKILIDTVAKTTTYLDAGTATTVDPAKETVTTPAAQYASEWAQTFGKPPTADDPNAWWNKAQTGVGEVRETISLHDGQHINKDGGAVRKVYELQTNGTPNIQFHVKATQAGRMRIQLAGKDSGSVNGGAALTVNGTPLGNPSEGELNSLDGLTSVQAGDEVTLFLRVDGGDNTLLLAVNPAA